MRVVNIIFIITLVIEFQTAHAQLIFPRAGVAISNMTYDHPSPAAKVLPRASVVVGLGIEFHLVKKHDILVECDYISRNFRVNVEQISGSLGYHYDAIYRQQHIDFPILLKRYFGRSPIKYYFSCGGYLGIGVGGTRNIKVASYNTSNTNPKFEEFYGQIIYGPEPPYDYGFDYIYYQNKIDYGILAGGGLMLFNAVVLDLRYGIGLVDVDESMGSYKNRTFQISLSVPLKLNPLD